MLTRDFIEFNQLSTAKAVSPISLNNWKSVIVMGLGGEMGEHPNLLFPVMETMHLLTEN